MPRVGNKEFSYTDDGMRQAQIYADRTGQRVEYQENNRKFGYQEGGYTSDEYLHNTLNNRKPWITGDSKLGRMLGYPTEETMDRAKELSQRKRTFQEKHGSLPEGIKEPPSLLDESIKWKLIKQLAGPPQWIKNYQEADQMMEEGFDRYGGMEDTWPAFVKGIKEAWGYQEGGGVDPVMDRPLDMMRRRYLGDAISSMIDRNLGSNINPSTRDNITDIRDIISNIDAYNKEIERLPETRSVTSPKNLLRREKDTKVSRLIEEMGMQKGGQFRKFGF